MKWTYFSKSLKFSQEVIFLPSCIPPDPATAILSPKQSDMLQNPQNQTKGCILLKHRF